MSTDSKNLYNTTGIQLPADACVVIVRTEWNAATIDKLEAGCVAVLNEHKVLNKIITVPGAFEIPFAIKKYWEQHKYKEDRPHAWL
jgi:6,7-dimethyl-8-ribityllumazine synthase